MDKKPTEAEDEIEDDEVTAAPIVVARDPGDPSKEEIEIHNATHLPHRSWCSVCILARGEEDPHLSNKKPLKEKPTVSFDYEFWAKGTRR